MNKLDNGREIAFIWNSITKEVWWTEFSTRTKLLGFPSTCGEIRYARFDYMTNSFIDQSWKLIPV